MKEAFANNKTILLNEREERLIRDLIVVRAFEIDEFLKSGKFSKIEKTELESELVAIHGLYMQFTGHGVIFPVSK